MSNYRIPGPMGCASNAEQIDQGTLCLAKSASPGPIGITVVEPMLACSIYESYVCGPSPATNSPYDFSNREGTIAAIRSECILKGLDLMPQISYVLATVDHETKHTFKPVREAYWLPNPDAYLKKHHPEYYPYYGRGFVQLTWKANYEKYGKLTGMDLVGSPDFALDPSVSLFVLVHGFKTGSFTGRKLEDYINATRTDFVNARRCINYLDRAADIAALAETYLSKL